MTYDYPYLRAFLAEPGQHRAAPETLAARTDKADQSGMRGLLSVLSVPREPVSRNRAVPAEAVQALVAQWLVCDGCDRDAWMALVADDGARTCIDCVTGRTAMRARGVPI
jgi:hypothetical protein